MSSAIATFKTGWAHTRGLTYDFIAEIPDERWEYSPHPRYAPFHKQVRHLVCVQGVYIGGVHARKTDFSKKHEHYQGALDRESLSAALQEKDRQLSEALAAIGPAEEADYTIDFYGTNTLPAFLSVIPYHEALHQGQWSFYATLGGFETPASWKLNWGL